MGLQYRSCWETMSGGTSIYFGTLKNCVGALVGRLRFKLHISYFDSFSYHQSKVMREFRYIIGTFLPSGHPYEIKWYLFTHQS